MAVGAGLGTTCRVDTADAALPVAEPWVGATWVELPNQQSCDVSFGREEVSANHKGNAGWADSVATGRSLEVTVTGFADPNDTAFLFLLDTKAMNASTDVVINISVINSDGDTINAQCSIGDLSISNPHDGLKEYSVTFASRGAPLITRA